MRHGTLRILLLYIQKRLFRLFIPERMEKGDTFFEGLLSLRRARDGKVHGPQLPLCHFVVMIFVRERGAAEYRGDTYQPDQFAHGAPQSESSGGLGAGSRLGSGGLSLRENQCLR